MTGDGAGLVDPLLAEVAGVLRRAEPVPADVVARARSALAWRSVAVSIAGLEFDSAVDDDDLARVRGPGAERRLRFRSPEGIVQMSVIDGGRRLVGRLEPRLASSVTLRHPAGSASAPVDGLGQFFFEALPRGSVSLSCVPEGAGRPGVETEWVTL